MDIRSATISEYKKALASGVFSAEEGVKIFLDAIREEDANLHAYLTVFEEDALAEARAVDTARQAGELLGPLAGVPIAVKDNILIHGTKTTAASKILENYIARYDATVIQKLRDAGVIFLGKTNLDEFAMGASTENSAFGSTKNPHNEKCVPGGSSGGSAAAVAADLAVFSLGSDTGGSIRQPAAFCGVVGFKPSYGAVSRFGLIAMASSLDQIGPITKSVEDAALVFDCIEGKDENDATSLGVLHGGVSDEAIKKIRIGIPKEYFTEGINETVKKAVEDVVKKFGADGFHTEEVSLPHTAYAIPTYYIIVPAEVSANLARFDGIRYPKNLNGINDTEKMWSDLYEKYAHARGYGFGDEVKRRVLLGTFVLSAGYYDAYYKKAEEVRALIANDFEKAFATVDVLLTPVTPTTAFRFGEKTDDPVAMYLSDVFTSPANLAGLPALSVPVKKYKVGSGELPINFQIIGKKFFDRDVLKLGDYYEKNLR